jgi:hypothetical protein
VLAEAFFGPDAAPGDSSGDAAPALVAADAAVVVGLVGVELDRSKASGSSSVDAF